MNGKVAELTGVVEAVADDELVLDLESDIFDLDVDLAAAGLAQQAGGPQDFRVAGAQDILQVVQREARVDDVFDDNDVAALQRRVEVFEQPHFAGAFRGGAVARDRDEVERHRAGRHRAGQVGEKDEGALEDGHEMQRLAVRVVGVDLRGELR